MAHAHEVRLRAPGDEGCWGACCCSPRTQGGSCKRNSASQGCSRMQQSVDTPHGPSPSVGRSLAATRLHNDRIRCTHARTNTHTHTHTHTAPQAESKSNTMSSGITTTRPPSWQRQAACSRRPGTRSAPRAAPEPATAPAGSRSTVSWRTNPRARTP